MTLELSVIIVTALFFIFGLLFGSFFNVVGIRTLNGEGLSYPPSHCMNCKHNLSFWDLFPVFSWLFLRGKCRYCRIPISPIYPVIELLTAVSYAIVGYTYGLSFETLIHIVFITVLVLCTATDLKEMIVPDRFIAVGLILILGLRIIDGSNILEYALSGAGAFLGMLIIFLASRGRMGGADVKLYALIGLTIGWMDSIGSLFYASFAALLYTVIASLLNKKGINMKKEIPFVPFITIGVLCTYLLDFFKF